MSNTIIELRHSSVTGNVPSSLANGEIAINTYDGKLFYRGGVSNTIQTIERYEGPAGLDGEIQFNDSGVLGATSGLSFNKSTNELTVNGNITANSLITTGSGGDILGANVIYANTFVANTGYIQFADGSKQYTANAGSGGGGTTDQYARDTANAAFIHANSAFNAANTGGGGSANSFGQVVANVGTILATSANDSIEFVGESGISVSSNISAKKVIVSVPAGYTFTTADYGFVYDDTNVIYDYGTL
jgi:hypothetical protein